jgi:preprotein translocase subunit SecA
MRVFASDMLKGMMQRLKIAEDEAIENRLITKSLETAQTRIEGFHFDSRKHTLEFDDVMNYQRKIIYEKRRKILLGDATQVISVLDEMLLGDEEAIKAAEEKKAELGLEQFANGARSLMLQTIDTYWMDHLEMMDYLRGSVNLRAYGQRDPLVEYKKDGLRLFKEMEGGIADTIASSIVQVRGVMRAEEPTGGIELHESTLAPVQTTPKLSTTSPQRMEERVGRNDPCPCGSGKKFKKCGELNTEEHQRLMAQK